MISGRTNGLTVWGWVVSILTEHNGWWATSHGKIWSTLSGRYVGDGQLNQFGYHTVGKREGYLGPFVYRAAQ